MVVRRSYDGHAMSYDARLSLTTWYDHRWSRMTSSNVYCTNIVRWVSPSHDVVRGVVRHRTIIFRYPTWTRIAASFWTRPKTAKTSWDWPPMTATSYNVVQRRTTSYNVVQRRTTSYNVYNVVQRRTTSYNVVQRRTTSYNVVQRRTIYSRWSAITLKSPIVGDPKTS